MAIKWAIKCVECPREAEYIYLGKSLCRPHFQDLVRGTKKSDKKKQKKVTS